MNKTTLFLLALLIAVAPVAEAQWRDDSLPAIAVVDGYHDVPTADSTDNILMRDVVGNKADALQTDGGATRSLVAHTKGVIAVIDVPNADVTSNNWMSDVVGNKTDAAAAGAVSATESIMAYIKQVVGQGRLIQPDATDNLSTIQATLDATLDMARAGDSGDYTMDGSEITIYEDTDTVAFVCYGGYIDWTGLNAAAGEDTTIKGYAKIESGGSYVMFYSETFLAAALPSPLLVPFPRDVNTQCVPGELRNIYGVKFTATQAAVGGGWNTLPVEVFDAKAGG